VRKKVDFMDLVH